MKRVHGLKPWHIWNIMTGLLIRFLSLTQDGEVIWMLWSEYLPKFIYENLIAYVLISRGRHCRWLSQEVLGTIRILKQRPSWVDLFSLVPPAMWGTAFVYSRGCSNKVPTWTRQTRSSTDIKSANVLILDILASILYKLPSIKYFVIATQIN
jgi:hypothetical protein